LRAHLAWDMLTPVWEFVTDQASNRVVVRRFARLVVSSQRRERGGSSMGLRPTGAGRFEAGECSLRRRRPAAKELVLINKGVISMMRNMRAVWGALILLARPVMLCLCAEQ